MPDSEWPFSDTVYVLTEASVGDVDEWAAGLGSDQAVKAEWNGRHAVVLCGD